MGGMALPKAYAWLADEPGPKMLVEALKLYGTLEMPGADDNPEILRWADETHNDRVYSSDSVPWCGLFLAVIAKRAGKEAPNGPLWALNWAKFGVPQPKTGAMLGDVLTFKRPGGGHVALYVGENKNSFHVIGGNQSDAVTITRIVKARLHSVSRPAYREQPANVRKVFLAASGTVSKNEA